MRRGETVAQTEEYDVEINGVKHTLLLDEDDAKRRGLIKTKQAHAPQNKQRKPDNKER